MNRAVKSFYAFPNRHFGPMGQTEQKSTALSNTSAVSQVFAIASVASTGLCTYHGYKRNDSIGWAIGWGILGALFPIVTPAIAFAQGFGERKK